MSYDGTIFKQDLKAIMNALGKDDFESLNIYANRIMSNAHIFKDSERMICGLLIKDLALTLYPLAVQKSPKPKSTAKALAAGFLRKIYDQQENVSTENLWSEYHTFSNKVNDSLLKEHEESAYSGNNAEFTHAAVKILIKKLSQNKQKLCDPNCLLFKGILNEISRLYKVHGGELSDEFAYALITALDRCYEYIVSIFGNTAGFEKEVDTRIMPEIEKILSIMENVERQQGRWINEIDSKLFELCSQWREYFLLYMEHGEPAKEKVVRLPEESRKKLTEAIARSLEEELPKKNR